MVIFGIKAEKSETLEEFIKDTNERLRTPDFVQNPYDGKLRKLKDMDSDSLEYYVIDMTPIYMHFYIGGLFPLMVSIVYFKTWLFMMGLIILSFGIFWTKYFIYFMLRLGIKKAGYIGPIKLINNQELLRYLLYEV